MLHILRHTNFVRKLLHCRVHTVGADLRAVKAPNLCWYWAQNCLKSAQTIKMLHMVQGQRYDLRGPEQFD